LQKWPSFSLKTCKDKEKVMNAIHIMIWHIKTYAPHQDRNGWHLQKFHDLLHIVRDIENYGSPNNVDADAAPNEKQSHLSCKETSTMCSQKRIGLFLK